MRQSVRRRRDGLLELPIMTESCMKQLHSNAVDMYTVSVPTVVNFSTLSSFKNSLNKINFRLYIRNINLSQLCRLVLCTL